MGQLATVDELIETLDLGGGDPARVKPDLLNRALDSAEWTVKQLTGRYFYPDPALVDGEDTAPAVTRTIRVRYPRSSSNYCFRVRIPDLRSATAVSRDGNVWIEGSDYDFDTFVGDEPYTSIYLYAGTASYGSPYTYSGSDVVDITGRWGWLEVPSDIKEAVLQIAARRYHRRNAMFADQVDTGQGAFDFRGGVHPDVQSTLRRYRPVQTALV